MSGCKIKNCIGGWWRFRSLGPVFRVSKWENCSSLSKRRKCENRRHRFSRADGKGGKRLYRFPPLPSDRHFNRRSGCPLRRPVKASRVHCEPGSVLKISGRPCSTNAASNASIQKHVSRVTLSRQDPLIAPNRLVRHVSPPPPDPARSGGFAYIATVEGWSWASTGTPAATEAGGGNMKID